MRIGNTRSGLLVCLLVPALASAAAISGALVTINDLAEGNPIVTVSGFDPTSLNVQSLAEQVDLHGEYLSNSAPAAGAVAVANFNFVEPAIEGGGISDTLNITITGHTPTSGDPNNVSVDLHFRSDPEAGTALPPLANGISIAETGALQSLNDQIVLAGGPTDLSVAVASDVVPEPATWGFMLVGASGAILARLRRRLRAM